MASTDENSFPRDAEILPEITRPGILLRQDGPLILFFGDSLRLGRTFPASETPTLYGIPVSWDTAQELSALLIAALNSTGRSPSQTDGIETLVVAPPSNATRDDDK